MGVRLFVNRALIWCLDGIDYEMPKLGSDGLVLGIRTLSMEPHSALMCLDSLRLPSCARNPHVGFNFKEITTAHTHVDSLSVRAHVFPYHVFFSFSTEWLRAQQATECREARRCPTQPQLT
ncbi:hypothetical protein M9H77_08638 [Catharanthus roseus]|uniref:Uncharacterized protein n=1 Tax=Catharanthus roseus TaxID=4058 RepID=A0ACC0BYP3_CATRO|nr:hypothetical protein M9H77_08638 [Catharanthus roseus]